MRRVMEVVMGCVALSSHRGIPLPGAPPAVLSTRVRSFSSNDRVHCLSSRLGLQNEDKGLGSVLQRHKQHPRLGFENCDQQTEAGLGLGLGLGHKDKEHQLALGLQTDEMPTSAYIHLPFCRRRCFYCDFAIVAVGERNEASAARIDSTMDGYVDSVCTEIAFTFRQWPPPNQVHPLKTLFFGGGTPSLLPAHHLARIIDTLERCCGLENNVEISMEMDPGTFNRVSLGEFVNCGVNRVSLGVQAFHDDFLKACGRSHGLQDVYDAIDTIHTSGLKNWSLDLISSLPHQTLELWEESLHKAVDAAPAHISVYDLQVEDGTKFGTWYKPGQHPLPNEESSAAFYRLASSLLREAGFEHYEISNYAKLGYQCCHNLVYWTNMPYYAFGLGATSFIHGQRFSRPRKWKEYDDFVKGLELCTSGQVQGLGHFMRNPEPSTSNGNVTDTVEDRLCDTIMLSLRLARGLDLTLISQTFGLAMSVCICKAFVPFVNSAHAIALDANQEPLSPERFSTLVSQGSTSHLEKGISFIRLADPEGFLLSNEIISSVFSSLPSR